jgi:hypothetical protein
MHTYYLFLHNKGFVYEKKKRRKSKSDKKVVFELNALTNEYNQLYPAQTKKVLSAISKDDAFIQSTPCFIHDNKIIVYPDMIKEFSCEDRFYVSYHRPLQRGLYYSFIVILLASYVVFFVVFILHMRK